MMTQRDKLLAKIQKNTKNASFQEVETLLRQHGFILDRVRGSHHRYRRGTLQLTIARHGARLSEYEVRLALDAVRQVRAEEDLD
jgi:hypothetical protein